jgi:hypothetical protein
MEQELIKPIIEGMNALKEGRWNAWTYNDYFKGFARINAKIANSATITDTQLAQVETARLYMDKVIALKEKGITPTREQHLQMAEEAVQDTIKRHFPSANAQDEVANSTASKGKGSTTLHTNTTNLRPARNVRPEQVKPGDKKIIDGQECVRNKENTGWVVVE